jgi:hypothetical protein
LGGTASRLRQLPPYALPMSALSADEPAGAHATLEPTEQAWSSPFPPSLAFMEEPWRAKPAAPLLRLLIPGLAMPADVSAQAQFRFPAYAPRTTPTLSPTRHRTFRAPLLAGPAWKTGTPAPPHVICPGGDRQRADYLSATGRWWRQAGRSGRLSPTGGRWSWWLPPQGSSPRGCRRRSEGPLSLGRRCRLPCPGSWLGR